MIYYVKLRNGGFSFLDPPSSILRSFRPELEAVGLWAGSEDEDPYAYVDRDIDTAIQRNYGYQN